MKKSWKQWMAITCALAMIVSLLPVTILAEKGVATPTDLGPVVEPVQENETAEEEKATVTAGIAVSKRDGKIYLTAVAEPELVGEITWEMRTPGRNEEKWTRIETTAVTLMIIPGSELIGKEIRFVLEDGTTPVLSYIVPELEPEEVPEEGTEEAAVEIILEETIEENETEPALEEEQDIEDYKTPLGLDDVMKTEPKTETETEEIIDGLDIRENADGMSVIINTVPKDAEIDVLGVEGDWVLVETEGEQGYIYAEDLEAQAETEEQPEETAEETEATEETEETEEPVEEAEEEVIDTSNMKVTIFTSRRKVMKNGDPITLTSKLDGFEGIEQINYQWYCDKGNGFEPVDGANSDSYTYTANSETLSWSWLLEVSF